MSSWLKYQGFPISVPSHSEIQQRLVQIKDKPLDFVGSKKWIGSFEVSLFFDSYGFPCKIIHVKSLNDDLSSVLYELNRHFNHKRNRSPVFIGGDVYAYCIVGVCGQEVLILDPHLESKEEKNGVYWKSLKSVGKKGAFYNFCFLQIKD